MRYDIQQDIKNKGKVINSNPTLNLSAKGGGIPQEDREPLTDEQADKLLNTVKDLPPYVFVMIGLYAGLRRKEIIALKWDSVFLDTEAPYLTVCRAWHTKHNRPVILDELKTTAVHRDIPLPYCPAECLREATRSNTISRRSLQSCWTVYSLCGTKTRIITEDTITEMYNS